MKFTTTSLSATQHLGETWGKKLRGDEIIALVGDLGAGKTALVQGLAKGVGAKTHVTSPTFVLEQIYMGTKNRVMHHFDVYRIETDEVDSTGLPEILGEGIVVVEWADKIRKMLPSDTIWIEIKALSETKREFILKLSDTQKYLI